MTENTLTPENEKYRDRKGQEELDSGTQGLSGSPSLSRGQVCSLYAGFIEWKTPCDPGERGFLFIQQKSKSDCDLAMF